MFEFRSVEPQYHEHIDVKGEDVEVGDVYKSDSTLCVILGVNNGHVAYVLDSQDYVRIKSTNDFLLLQVQRIGQLTNIALEYIKV